MWGFNHRWLLSSRPRRGPDPGVRFTAGLDRNTQLQPPFEVVALRLASFELVKAEMSPAYSQACALTNSNTMLDCTLLPDPGPGWENGNPLFVRVRLTATDGHSDVQLVNLSTGGAGTGTILAQLNAGTGPSPATTNGTPVYLVTTLSRGVSGQSPFDSSALELASFELAAADFSPGFASACVFSNANTLLECALTPSPGPTWSAGGPMSVRVHVSAVDGTGATQLVSLRIN